MNNGANESAAHELSLINLYMELTGASEFTARGVFMHVCCRECGDGGLPDEEEDTDMPAREKAPRGSFAPRITKTKWLNKTVAAPACS